MTMKAKNCDECKNAQLTYGCVLFCHKGHKPRYYKNKTGNPCNTDWGWKRKCEDFEAKNEQKI
jgi:hypothetical protein